MQSFNCKDEIENGNRNKKTETENMKLWKA